MESILTSIKEDLQIDESNEEFDVTILGHINTAISYLHQMGIGPSKGFLVTGKDDTWGQLLGSEMALLASARTYIYISTKLVFDPPASSAIIDSMNRQKNEAEWRLTEAAADLSDK